MCNAFLPSTDAVDLSRENEADDRLLLAALARGQQEAFWTLWLRHVDKIFAVCLREMKGNRADAEDALGQAMMRSQQKLPRFASRVSSAPAWLTRVASNVCRDILRARARHIRAEEHLAHVEWEQFQRLLHASAGETSGSPPGIGTGDVSSLIARLPDRLRGVFTLRILQDRSYEEIASQLRVTCATARKRVQQARATLRGWRDAA